MKLELYLTYIKMDSIELTLLLTAIIGVLIYIYLVFNFNYWRKRGVDGPKPRPLFGNIPSNITQARHAIYDVNDIYRAFKSKERFVGIFSMRTPQLLAIDPKLIQEVLTTNFKSFHDNELSLFVHKDVDPIFGLNPFLLNGSEWKEKRAEVTPALTGNRIKASYPIMQVVCSKMTKYLEKEILKPQKDGFYGRELAAKFTTEVVANCIYGVEGGAFSDGKCHIQEMGAKVIEYGSNTFLYAAIFAAFPLFAKICRRPFIPKETKDFFIILLNDALELRKKNKSDRVDFLNYLLQLQEKKNLSSVEMLSHTMTFFIDGFDTSSIVISNCLHLLAENKNVQKTLREEIKDALRKEKEISFEKLHELPYLDQCINETLRIRPPGLLNNKICTEPCEITTNKDKTIKIDKGTVVVLPYYSIHHDEEFYPNPEEFDPDRFSLENGGVKKYKDLGVFLPFGDGPRICLGMKFAICQIKAVVVEIIQNWNISVNPKTKRDFVVDRKAFLCLPEGGTWLDFERINN